LDAEIDAKEANFKLKLIPITDPRVLKPRFIIKNSKRALNIQKAINDSRAKVRESRGELYDLRRKATRAMREAGWALKRLGEVPHKGGRSTRRNRKNKKSRKYTRRN
jgi:hypothetical protein